MKRNQFKFVAWLLEVKTMDRVHQIFRLNHDRSFELLLKRNKKQEKKIAAEMKKITELTNELIG